MFNDTPAKLLMQITRGGSEIAGPAFTPDGSRLYFSSQQKALPFSFRERLNVAPAVTVTSEAITIDGFYGPLVVTISDGSDAEFRVNEGPWTSEPSTVEAGDTLRVRHTSSANIGEVVETVVAIGLPNGASRTDTVFFSMTSEPDTQPDPFDFGTQEGVPPGVLIESETVILTGFNLPAPVRPGPHLEYRIDGGDWTSEPGTLAPEQTLRVRHLSKKNKNAAHQTHIRVADTTGHFMTRTAAN